MHQLVNKKLDYTYCVTGLGVFSDVFCSEITLYVVLCRNQHSLKWTNEDHIRRVEDGSVNSIYKLQNKLPIGSMQIFCASLKFIYRLIRFLMWLSIIN